jgi:hypothetical protein
LSSAIKSILFFNFVFGGPVAAEGEVCIDTIVPEESLEEDQLIFGESPSALRFKDGEYGFDAPLVPLA